MNQISNLVCKLADESNTQVSNAITRAFQAHRASIYFAFVVGLTSAACFTVVLGVVLYAMYTMDCFVIAGMIGCFIGALRKLLTWSNFLVPSVKSFITPYAKKMEIVVVSSAQRLCFWFANSIIHDFASREADIVDLLNDAITFRVWTQVKALVDRYILDYGVLTNSIAVAYFSILLQATIWCLLGVYSVFACGFGKMIISIVVANAVIGASLYYNSFGTEFFSSSIHRLENAAIAFGCGVIENHVQRFIPEYVSEQQIADFIFPEDTIVEEFEMVD